MSKLTRQDYISKFFMFREVMEYKILILNKTFKVIIMRGDHSCNYSTQSIVVLNGRIKLPKLLSEIGLRLSDWVDEIETMYMYDTDFKEIFDSMSYTMRMTTDDYRSKMELEEDITADYEWFDLSPEDYFKIITLSKDVKNNTLIYSPLDTEREMVLGLLEREGTLKTPFGLLTMDNKFMMLDKMSNLNKMVKSYYDENFLSKGAYDNMEGDYKTMTVMTKVSEWVDSKLEVKRFKYWLKSRHNIFGKSVLEEMKMDFEGKFDLTMSEKFDYNGVDKHLTPDYVFEEDDAVYMVDFAVTTADPGFIRDKKIKKYEELRNGLSDFLKKEVIMDAVVWKINSDNEMQIPEFFEAIRNRIFENTDMKVLMEIHLIISSMENYEMLRSSLDDIDDPNTKAGKKVRDLMYINNALVKMYSFEKAVSYDISDSRKTMDKLTKEPKKMEDMNFYKELFSMTSMNERKIMNKVTNEMAMFLEKGDLPKYLNETMKVIPEVVQKKMDSILTREETKRIKFNKNLNFKMGHVFKFPFLDYYSQELDEYCFKTTPMYWPVEMELKDGTQILKKKCGMEMPDKEKENLIVEYNVDGIGLSEEDDESLMEDILAIMMAEADITMKGIDDWFLDIRSCRDDTKDFMKTNMFMIMDFWANMMEDICYLNGRRHVLNKGKGNTVFKNFGKYMIAIKYGSKLTTEKQIRFQLYTHKNMIMDENGILAQKWMDFDLDPELKKTKWLAISITDIQHFLKLREVSLSMISDYNDKKMEMNRSDNITWLSFDKSIITQLVVLLENRRGTSTSSQLNRYIVHAALGFVNNRVKIIDDISDSPCRSQIEAYIRIRQLKWFNMMTTKAEDHWSKRLLNMHSTETDYDRVFMPSFYDFEEEIEFGMMMSEMYVSNLFEKSSGFNDHRMKSIVSKMTKAELHFQKVKMSEKSQGIIKDRMDFWKEEDDLHCYDREFVVAATKMYFSSENNNQMFQEAFLKAMLSVVDTAMMMTSSLKAGPYESKVLDFRSKITKSKSFLTIFEEVDKMDTNVLATLVNVDDMKEAIFTIFPKAQIGGPREILIQSIKMRLYVKFIETLSREFSKTHPKEMVTKDRRKAEIQSETMSEHKKKLEALKKKGIMCCNTSLNMDATKWAPGFMMEHFAHFVYNWNIPIEMKNLLVSIVSSFSNKIVLTPEALKEKWLKKPKSELEYDESIESFRQLSEQGNGIVILESGMGQGMFHLLSSLYHCIMDDSIEMITDKLMKSQYNTITDTKTLISSDDKTKMILFTFLNNDAEEAEKAMKSYIVCTDLLYRLANIHTNWKKSSLHFTITEFNSLFSIGKRMCWATVKDLYNANSIPDLTSPEEACTFMLGNIRRCFEHGVFLPTIKLMMTMARNQLKRYYRFDKSLIDKLCSILDVEEKDLPFQIGFFPIDYPIETMIYGLDLHMFKHEKDTIISKYYMGLFTAMKDSNSKRTRKAVPFSESCSGKFWLELPTKLDVRLKTLKKGFFDNMIQRDPEEVMALINMRALMTNNPENDFRHYLTKVEEYFIGMNRKYEFQENMVVHSLVRALQMPRSEGIIYPREAKYEEAEMKIKIIKNKENSELELEELEMELENEKVDVVAFVKFILTRNEEDSSLKMLEGFRKVISKSNEFTSILEGCNKNKRMLHPNMKTMRFYMTDVTMNSKAEEILSFLFESEKDFRNSTVNAFDSLISLSSKGITMASIMKNPFMFIKDLMGSDDYSFKSFKDFLSYHNKSLRFVKINMLCENQCSGNAFQNILNLYKSRSNPAYVLEDRTRFQTDEVDMMFLTKMSMGEIKMELTEEKFRDFEEENSMITSLDNAVARARKLTSGTYNGMVDCMTFSYDRIEYKSFKKESITYKSWFDGRMIIRVMEDSSTKMSSIDILAREEITYSTNERLISVLRRYLHEMYEKAYLVSYIQSEEEYNEEFFYRIDKTIQLSVKVDYKFTYWRLFLVVAYNNPLEEEKKNDVDYNNRNYFETFLVLKDYYSISSKLASKFWLDVESNITLSSIVYDPPDIRTLDKLFNAKGWMKERILTSKEETIITEDYNTLIDFMASFGGNNLKDTISRNAGLTLLDDDLFPEQSDNENVIMEMDKDMIAVDEMKENNFTIVSKALETMKNKKFLETSTPLLSERTSVIEIMDKAITESFKQEYDVNKQRLKKFYRLMSERTSMMMFHNTILMEIFAAFNFEISDSMAVALYSIILKSNRDMYMLKPSTKLRKFKNYRKLDQSYTFLERVKEESELGDWLLENDLIE